jgi:hypothetical protein
LDENIKKELKRIAQLEPIVLGRVRDFGPIRKREIIDMIAPADDLEEPTDRQLLEEHILRMVIDGKLRLTPDGRLQSVPPRCTCSVKAASKEGPTLG